MSWSTGPTIWGWANRPNCQNFEVDAGLGGQQCSQRTQNQGRRMRESFPSELSQTLPCSCSTAQHHQRLGTRRTAYCQKFDLDAGCSQRAQHQSLTWMLSPTSMKFKFEGSANRPNPSANSLTWMPASGGRCIRRNANPAASSLSSQRQRQQQQQHLQLATPAASITSSQQPQQSATCNLQH